MTNNEIIVDDTNKIKCDFDNMQFTIETNIKKNTNADEISLYMLKEYYLIFPFMAYCDMKGIDVEKAGTYVASNIGDTRDVSAIKNNLVKVLSGEENIDLGEFEKIYKDKKAEYDVFTIEFKEKEKTDETYSYNSILTIKKDSDFSFINNIETLSDLIEKANKSKETYEELAKKEREAMEKLLDEQANKDRNELAGGTNQAANDTNTTGAQNEKINGVNELPLTGINSTRISTLWVVLVVASISLIGYIIYNRKEK